MNSIEYQPIESIKISEPRIEYLRKKIENIFKMVELCSDGKPVKIDGFCLKDLGHWTVPSYQNTLSLLEPLGRRCNLDCKFCYLKGNPPDIAIAKYHDHISDEEMDTLLRYYNPKKNYELFRNVFEVKEILCHPKVFLYLSKIRRKTKKPIFIVTNGTTLNEKNVAALAKLRPIFIVTSLNSRNICLRSRLMKDDRARIAIEAPKLLKKYKVPFGVSITPWLQINEDDLKRTMIYADRSFASFIRVILPGYTKFVSKKPLFKTHELWRSIVGIIKEMRPQLRTPLFCVPSVYEVDHLNGCKNQAVILGCIRNSPSNLCGVKAEDVIVKINKWKVANRYEAKMLLYAIKNDDFCRITVKRGEHLLDMVLKAREHDYPYYKDANTFYEFPFGIVMPMGFDHNILKEVISLVKKHKAKNVAILASELIAPILKAEIKKLNLKSRISKGFQAKINVLLVKNHYLGGNMMIGDMLVAEDFIKTIRAANRRHRNKYDLFILSSSSFDLLSNWRMDIKGDSISSIASKTGEQIEFIGSTMIGF